MQELARDHANDSLVSIAATLAGEPVARAELASNSGNSRVYKITAGDKFYALKEYPSIANDPRNRLETERRALELMATNTIASVPTWIASENNYALFSWIDGAIIKAPTERDIEAACDFLSELHALTSAGMPLASEACLSGQIIATQIEKRLQALAPHAGHNPALAHFLTTHFQPALKARLGVAKTYPGFATELPPSERTLIAADFGFHNIMRTPGGALRFIDFEYFGWDDPVKLMGDFLLHPATPLAPALKTRFRARMLAVYGPASAARFAAYYPLFGLRWALILLNEFIPERWAARASAKGRTDWDNVKTEQLAKAQLMLAASERCA